MKPPPILVATCGNPRAGDDAIGPLVAARLLREPIPGVEIVDLGMSPASLLDHLPGRSALVVIDAVCASGGAVGELIDCDWGGPTRPRLLVGAGVSTHGVSIVDQIELARRLGMLPLLVRLIAVTIDATRLHGDPSDAGVFAINAAEIAARRVLHHLTQLADVHSGRP